MLTKYPVVVAARPDASAVRTLEVVLDSGDMVILGGGLLYRASLPTYASWTQIGPCLSNCTGQSLWLDGRTAYMSCATTNPAPVLGVDIDTGAWVEWVARADCAVVLAITGMRATADVAGAPRVIVSCTEYSSSSVRAYQSNGTLVSILWEPSTFELAVTVDESSPTEPSVYLGGTNSPILRWRASVGRLETHWSTAVATLKRLTVYGGLVFAQVQSGILAINRAPFACIPGFFWSNAQQICSPCIVVRLAHGPSFSLAA